MAGQLSAERIRERVEAQAKEAGLELAETEEEALDRACYLATVVEEIDAVVREEGLTCHGPGGTRVHPLVPERRNTIALLHRLIASIELNPAKVGESPSQTGRRAASARYRNHPAKKPGRAAKAAVGFQVPDAPKAGEES